ncbi:hypothetical protein [Catelliglobosispora koreensis]|uniref:hypothetical protein n=1 Tax=Catelliglobosispora koreensis TaxID=129052 RepID=UPI0003652711|nr:hypothetical protein [Catelliglobosispora koreensis]
MNTTPTQAQQFAAAYAADMAAAMLKTIKRVRQSATVIMLIAMVVSYTHQATFLDSIGTGVLGAWLIPGALDALTFLCVKVLGTAGMHPAAKSMAMRVLVFPVLASGFINVMGPGNWITKLVFVVAVLLIPAAELVATRIKPDFTAMDAMERDITPAAAPEADEELTAQRRASALKAAETRRERKAEREAKAEAQREARRARAAARKLEELAPTSPGHPAVILSASDKEALAHLMAA